MSSNKGDIAQCLVSLGCFKVSLSPPYTYGSGLRGPIYCDNRKILSHPEERGAVLDSMRHCVARWEGKFDSIVGIATGGIPFGFSLAEKLGVPFLYVRSKAKEYGKKRCLEGHWREGDRVILVEDLVNQGSAMSHAIKTLREEGLSPLACFSLVDYQTERAQKIFREENLEHIPLTNLDALLNVVEEKLNSQEREAIHSWRLDPRSWGR